MSEKRGRQGTLATERPSSLAGVSDIQLQTRPASWERDPPPRPAWLTGLTFVVWLLAGLLMILGGADRATG